MQFVGVEEIACDSSACRDCLPFELGGEPRSGPARVGVGFVETHMANGFVGIDGALTIQGINAPVAVSLFPIEWRAPAIRADRVPCIGQPQLRARVSSIVHKLHVLGVTNKS